MVEALSRVVVAALAVASLTVACASGPALGQRAPGATPELFAPGVVSTDAAVELNAVLSPDGRELLFTRRVDERFTIHSSRLLDGRWSEARPLRLLPGAGPGDEVDMSLSGDGRHLYFLGRPGTSTAAGDLDIWVSERRDGEWTEAQRVPPPISTEARETYPWVVADGSLYFSSDRAGGLGESDLYRAQRLPDGSFAAPVNLGPPVNTAEREGDAFVAADESYLVFTARRPGGRGQADLYVAFRDAAGAWGEPCSLGDAVNSALTEYCPVVSPDGRVLFFSRRDGDTWAETTAGDVLWVDAAILERLRPPVAASP